MPASNLLIFGASTRAAAFSALRAGLLPWCADLFADADLQARCPVTKILPATYPQAFLELCRGDQAGPWIYTGGLENHGHLVQVMANERPLFGNNRTTLQRARSPDVVAAIVARAGLPVPALFYEYPAEFPSEGRWLIKPIHSAGGAGIRFWDGRPQAPRQRRQVYLQEYIEGEACSAVYVGDGHQARLLGVTQQLVGEARVNAAPFHYCGSIGPLEVPPSARGDFERLGKALTAGCGLQGLFGVDCVLADGAPYPVEVNPRYPASVEVLEYALGTPALALHWAAFDPSYQFPCPLAEKGGTVVGKAILFARADLTFPADGPWTETLRHSGDIHALPAFADIPQAGQRIEAGRPILTVFAGDVSVAACRDQLWAKSAELERGLYGV
jgi:predicted ATP-grasp superfamily ATP-dependent carboligase